MPFAGFTRLKRLCLLLAGVTVMTGGLMGCSMFGIGSGESSREAYLRAEILPPMEIPADLDSFTIDELYVVPPAPEGERAFYPEPPPPRPMDARIRDGVVVQRFGDRAWIVVGAAPAQAWPTVRDYWATEEIALTYEDPIAGVMHTEWLPDESMARIRHKYQVRVEPGLHGGNTEIIVRHISDASGSGDSEPLEWPAESEDLERERELLGSLSRYLADRTDLYRASSVSLLAGSIAATGKAQINSRAAGDTRLELAIDFDRAWSQIGQALDGANIEIVERNRDERFYKVAFSGEESEGSPGFFRRLFGAGRRSDEDLTPFTVRLVEEDGMISIRAATDLDTPAPYEQDLLIRTINENLI